LSDPVSAPADLTWFESQQWIMGIKCNRVQAQGWGQPQRWPAVFGSGCAIGYSKWIRTAPRFDRSLTRRSFGKASIFVEAGYRCSVCVAQSIHERAEQDSALIVRILGRQTRQTNLAKD
jgi:hypothetical protein